jgi:hypothetical protein
LGLPSPPQLKNPKRWSASSSNFTLLNHKEDYLVKKISKTFSGIKKNVVVTAGLHWDNLTSGGNSCRPKIDPKNIRRDSEEI